MQDDQIDHKYLAAIDELAKMRGMKNTAICAQFTANMFGLPLSQVIIDAVEQSAAYGTVFGAA